MSKRWGRKKIVSKVDQERLYWAMMYPGLSEDQNALVRDCCAESPTILHQAHTLVRNAASSEFKQPGMTPAQQWIAIVADRLDKFRLAEFHRIMAGRAKEEAKARYKAKMDARRFSSE